VKEDDGSVRKRPGGEVPSLIRFNLLLETVVWGLATAFKRKRNIGWAGGQRLARGEAKVRRKGYRTQTRVHPLPRAGAGAARACSSAAVAGRSGVDVVPLSRRSVTDTPAVFQNVQKPLWRVRLGRPRQAGYRV